MSKKDLIVPNIINNFSISFLNHPRLDYGITEITMPGMSVSPQETFAGVIRTKLPPRAVGPDRDEFIVTFNVDENYDNYYEIFAWIVSYRDAEITNIEDLLNDITIIHYDLNKIPIRNVILKNCFPTMLSDISLNNNETTFDPAMFTSNFAVNKILIEYPE